MDLNMSSLAHAYPRCGTLCDMIILCTADFNVYAPDSVHEGDIKRAVDEQQYAQVIDRPEISEHASARIPELRKTTRTIQDAFGMAPWQAGGRAGEVLLTRCT